MKDLRQVNKFNTKKSNNNIFYCSNVICCTWFLIIIWTLFLMYCWHIGLVDTKKVNIIASEVNSIIKEVESEVITVLDPKNKKFLINNNNNKPKIESNSVKSDLNKSISSKASSNTIVTDSNTNSNNNNLDNEIHIVFSTDCSEYQDWQTLLLFHSAKTIGQQGRITRIASGCTELKEKQLTELYQKLYPQYYVHFTPDFKKDEKTKKSYDFYNKPWGMKHWLEFSKPSIPENTYIALLDPDMILIRPITRQVKNDPNSIFNVRYYKPEEIVDEISRGHPVAQMYGLGAPWTNDNHKKFNRGKICLEGSPCLLPNMRFGEMHYSVGPPYIAHKTDMHAIVDTWTEFVPRVYEGYPYLLAEMYAYSMAAAHEKLPHVQLENYMVSNIDSGGEGWPHVDALPAVCVPPDQKTGVYYPGAKLPTVIHYCQGYRAGELGWFKRRIPKNIFSCESPLLTDPSTSLANSTYIVKNNEKQAIKNARSAKRNAFILCIAYTSLNAALMDYKQRMCSNHPKVNYARTININDL